MNFRKFKPLVDKLFWIIFIPTVLLILALSVLACLFPAPIALFIVFAVDLAVLYLLISPLFGYVELRESSLYIKYGLLLKKEIPYAKIRGASAERKLYSDSMLSLKNAFPHVNIKYNAFDTTTVSVVGNDSLLKELNKRIF